jgi:catechol 2,3-dioxygenase-like lactoylglutathione lyase family enzyme
MRAPRATADAGFRDTDARVRRTLESSLQRPLRRTMTPPFESLDYLYLSAPDLDAAVAFYAQTLGGELLWRIHEGATRVAAVRLAATDLVVVLASHLAAGHDVFVYRVADLAAAQRELDARGWSADVESVEMRQGPCRIVRDPSGHRIGIYERTRPWFDARLAGRIDSDDPPRAP